MFGLLLPRLGRGRLGQLAQVRLRVLVFAGAGFECRLALTLDVKPAGVSRLDLIWARRSLDQFGLPVHRSIALAEPEKCSGDDQSGKQDHHQRSQHPARGNAAWLVLVVNRGQPRQRLIEGAVIAHRSTLDLHGRPTIAQLRSMRCMRWHNISEWAWEVVPT